MAYSIDTRTIQPGDIFIPIKGDSFDGHDFIELALAKGAKEILDVDLAEFARKKRTTLKIPIIAVTGSAGKTTVKDMLAAVLAQKFKVYKSPENNNNEIGVPLSLINITECHEVAILELAMRGSGQIEHLAEIVKPTQAIITNIGWTHLELLGSRDAIALAKAEIISKGLKLFLNKSDDYYNFLRERAEAAGAKVVGFLPESAMRANEETVRAVAKEFGLTAAQIEAGLNSMERSAHRLKIIAPQNKSGLTIIDDTYNSNPDGLIFALNFLREQAGANRKIAVLGDMKELGDYALMLHQNIDVTGIDVVVSYGELAQNIKHQKHFAQDEAEQLLKYLKEILNSGDHLLFKGSRSMQMEKMVAQLVDS